jgi:hypothetical protein
LCSPSDEFQNDLVDRLRFRNSYLIHAFSGLPSLDQSESSLSSVCCAQFRRWILP